MSTFDAVQQLKAMGEAHNQQMLKLLGAVTAALQKLIGQMPQTIEVVRAVEEFTEAARKLTSALQLDQTLSMSR